MEPEQPAGNAVPRDAAGALAHAAAPAATPAGAALVLFSGGQDSTVCLAWALGRYALVETVGFDYGQRHRVELEQRSVVRQQMPEALPHLAPRLGQDHLLEVDVLGKVSESALTRERAIELQSNGLPNTFVPGRNLVFLTLAAALAYRRSIRVLVGGMCETDFSGYPDCRNATIEAMQQALCLGLDEPFHIETPLMWSDKAQTWALAESLGGAGLVQLVVEHTHTCYLGQRDRRHDWGYGCGQCPACRLRASGWERWVARARDGSAVP
jgi:7-cyano-7-deazaguanine synthase